MAERSTQTQWFNLAGVLGPRRVYAFDVDNLTREPVQVELVRKSGVVLVRIAVLPYHAHTPSPLTGRLEILARVLSSELREEWLWEAEPDREIYVPGDDWLTLRATAPLTVFNWKIAPIPMDEMQP